MKKQPFASPGEALAHFGVKGMKWGVRKDRESGSDDARSPAERAQHNADTKMYMAEARKLPEPKNLEEVKANLKANQVKFARKFEPSEGPILANAKKEGPPDEEERSGLSSKQKKALIFAGGTVAVVGGVYLLKRSGVSLNPVDFAFDKVHQQYAGKPIEPDTFRSLVGTSQMKSWGGDRFITDKSFAREAFSLPAGHEFLRISTAAEDGFRGGAAGRFGTYCTHSADDFNRYVAGFRQELWSDKLYKVAFKSTSETRVPNLTSVLGEMSEVLKREGAPSSPQDTLRAYQELSGGGWNSDRAVSLFGRLKAKGFHAIVDEMDAGVIGETPLVHFGDNTTAKTATTLASESIKQAESALKEIGIPPGRKP